MGGCGCKKRRLEQQQKLARIEEQKQRIRLAEIAKKKQ